MFFWHCRSERHHLLLPHLGVSANEIFCFLNHLLKSCFNHSKHGIPPGSPRFPPAVCPECGPWPVAHVAHPPRISPDLQCMNSIISASGSWRLALHLLRQGVTGSDRWLDPNFFSHDPWLVIHRRGGCMEFYGSPKTWIWTCFISSPAMGSTVFFFRQPVEEHWLLESLVSVNWRGQRRCKGTRDRLGGWSAPHSAWDHPSRSSGR